MKAQWRLVYKGKLDNSMGGLFELAVDQSVDEMGENLPAVHALWTSHLLKRAVGLPDNRSEFGWKLFLGTSLHHPSSGVRRAAAQNLPRTEEGALAILLNEVLDDPDPVVRRLALETLAECPPVGETGKALVEMLRKPENLKDRWIPLAATSAAARSDVGFLTAAFSEKDSPEATQKIIRIVSEHYARGEHAAETVNDLLASLPDASPSAIEPFLAGLAAGWTTDQPPEIDSRTQDALIALMGKLDTAGQLSLATLANRWKIEGKFTEAMKALRERLASEAADAGRPETERIASASRLARMDPSPDELEGLLSEINAKASPSLTSGFLNAVSGSTSPKIGDAVLAHWSQFTPALRKQALDLLLKRPEWTRALLNGLENGPLSVTDLSIDQSRQLTEHPNKPLARRARKLMEQGGRLPSPDRQKVLAELLPITERTGDASAGREVFKKNCAKCHKVGDLGERIGPNLTGFNVHPKEKILTEIIDPNRSVEGNYRQYTVATSEGQVISGLLASETRTGIELIDGEAKRHIVLRDDIDEMIASPKSLMPEGFEKQITGAEFADLLEFLTAKGKFVPLPLDKAATIVSTRGMFYSKDAEAERLIFPDWTPKTIDGIPFILVDPREGRVPNVVLLHSNSGPIPRTMPRAVSLPCNTEAKSIHLLSGISGWGYPFSQEKTVSLIVRLHYADGSTEDHLLRNGVEFADYIRRVDVPGSTFAFALRGQQVRYLSLKPEKSGTISTIEFIKGPDASAPVVMAVTVERP
jgi:putative heme-binding domain-containing protein